MKSDKEIVGTLLGFDDFVSILVCVCVCQCAVILYRNSYFTLSMFVCLDLFCTLGVFVVVHLTPMLVFEGV